MINDKGAKDRNLHYLVIDIFFKLIFLPRPVRENAPFFKRNVAATEEVKDSMISDEIGSFKAVEYGVWLCSEF